MPPSPALAGSHSRTPPATLGDPSLSPGPPPSVRGRRRAARGPRVHSLPEDAGLGATCRVTRSSRAWLFKVGAELAQCKGLLVPQGKLWAPEEPPAPGSQHTSTSDTLVISMPGSPTLASLSQEASREPKWQEGEGWGRLRSGLAHGDWGKPGQKLRCQRGVAALGPPKGPHPGVGWLLPWSGRAPGGRCCHGSGWSVVQSGYCPGSPGEPAAGGTGTKWPSPLGRVSGPEPRALRFRPGSSPDPQTRVGESGK